MGRFILIFIFLVNTCFSQIIRTFAGTGVGSYTGDGGLAINATFSEPQGVMLDDTGNVYIVDEDDNVIRKISSLGMINTIIGSGLAGFSGDGGPAKFAKLTSPGGCAIDRKGNIYIADSYNHAIRKVNRSGIISTVAGHGTVGGYGGDGANGTSAYLNFPEMVAVDRIGNVYITDASNDRIRKLDTNGIITTIAGNGTPAYSGDGGLAINATLNYPMGIVVDTTSGVIYFSDANNNVVRKIDTNGIITTIAGNGLAGYSGNGGPATTAKLNNPQGITIDTAGTIYVSDGGNNVVRKIDTAGIIVTYAGTCVAGYSGDGGPAIFGKIFNPPGITVDVTGNLYIAEYYNARVRKVSFCPSPLNVSVSGTDSLCTGDSVTLKVNGASTYTWSANADSSHLDSVVIKPVANTTYSVVGVDGTCYAIDSVLIIVNTCGANIGQEGEDVFKIYPNPATDVLNVECFQHHVGKIEISNILGEKISEALLHDDVVKLHIEDLTHGIYFATITSPGAAIHREKFIKQ
ncbi:MAG: NHL domain-containing protein [Bacteroidia bacterium]